MNILGGILKMKRITLLITAMLLSGCAGVFKGTTQVVTFNSNPSGADVIIDGNNMGQTPLSVKLKKNKYKNVLIKKNGYKNITHPLDTSYDPVTLVNVVWDSSTTDLITGAAYEYEPNMFNFNLEADATAKK